MPAIDRLMLRPNKERAQTTVWLTPPKLLERLGHFDLDPCAAVGQLWKTADTMWTEQDDGLSKEWFGRVFVNPPYGLSARKFLEKMVGHDDGLLLISLRGDAHYFHDLVWNRARAMLVFRRRIKFFRPDGTESSGDLGGASALFAYGQDNVECLRSLRDLGYFTNLTRTVR